MRWAILILLVLLPAAAPADGCAFKAGLHWPRLAEHAQSALIAWRDGRQRMALAVRLDLARGEGGIWLVPLRGRPADIRVELAEDLPWAFGGKADPERRAFRRLSGAFTACATLSAPGAPLCWLLSGLLMPNLLSSRAGAGHNEITSVSRDGLVASILPALPPAELAARLAALDRPVPAERLTTLAAYADGGHSILAVRIDALAEGAADGSRWQGRMPAVLVDMPSASPWFPLRASAGGGATQLQLVIEGWWQGEAGGDRGGLLVQDARYMRGTDGQAAALDWLGWPREQPPPRITAVRGRLEAPADFAADLVFAAVTRPSLQRAEAINALSPRTWLLCGWGLLLLSGVLGGAIAGRLLLRRPGWGAAAGLSLGVGGSFGLWWLVRYYTCTRVAPDAPILPQLEWGRWLATSLASILVMLLVGMLDLSYDAWWLLPAVLIGCAAVYAGLWADWLRKPPAGAAGEVVRRHAAWVHTTLAFAVSIQALVVAPLLAGVAR